MNRTRYFKTHPVFTYETLLLSETSINFAAFCMMHEMRRDPLPASFACSGPSVYVSIKRASQYYAFFRTLNQIRTLLSIIIRQSFTCFYDGPQTFWFTQFFFVQLDRHFLLHDQSNSVHLNGILR